MNTNETQALARAVVNAGNAFVTAVEPKPVIPMDQTKPKPNCRHCYGRGYIGRDNRTKAKITCRCVVKQNKKTKVQGAKVDNKAGW